MPKSSTPSPVAADLADRARCSCRIVTLSGKSALNSVGNLVPDRYAVLGGFRDHERIGNGMVVMNRHFAWVFALIVSLGNIGAASAADIPAPVYKAPPAVIVSTWTGFYTVSYTHL